MVKQEKILCNIDLTKNDIFLSKVINRDAIIMQPGQDMFPKTRRYSTGITCNTLDFAFFFNFFIVNLPKLYFTYSQLFIFYSFSYPINTFKTCFRLTLNNFKIYHTDNKQYNSTS